MLTPIRVLMLEDRPADAELLAHELRRAGFDPDWRRAENELEYLAHLEAPHDLILADYSLPEFDAIRALQILRMREVDIPLIIVTGSISEEAAVECIKLGAADYLLKDRLARLGSAVRQALTQQELRSYKRMAEAALQESEERFRAIFHSTALGIAIVDIDGRLSMSNPAFQEMLGYTGEELQRMAFIEYTHPDDAASSLQRFNELVAGECGRYQIEKRYVQKGGQLLWVRLSVSLARDAENAPQFVIVTVEDITTRRQADETRARLAAIVASSDDAIFGTAPDGTILSWNASAQRIYGYTSEDVIGQPAAILAPPALQGESAQLLERLRSGERISHYETTRARNDGRLIDVALTISPIKDAQDNVAGFSTIARDISERKRAEQTLRRQTAFVHLLQVVAVAANEAASVEDALQIAIDQICVHIGWPVGHVYLPDPETPGAFTPTQIWHLKDLQRFDSFRKITEAVHLAPRVGLPGRALATRKPAWISDMILDPTTPRTRLIRDIGVRASFAFPVLVGDEVTAVLEFFSTEAIEPDEELLDIMAHVGAQLGRIFERTRAERALRESEERFRVVFEYSPDAILLLDPRHPDISWPIVGCNTAACRMNGYTREELISRSIDFLQAAEADPIERAAYLDRLRSSGMIHLEAIHRRKDGTFYPIDVSTSLIILAGRELVMGTYRDITERKQAEETLARYQLLSEHARDIILFLSHDGQIIEANQAALVAYGYTRDELLARSIYDLRPVEAQREVTARMAQVDSAGISYEATHRRKDGQIFPVEIGSRGVAIGGERVIVSIIRDITERKQAEEASRQAEQRYRDLFEEAPVMYVITSDRAGIPIITDCNEEFSKTLGYPRAELLEQPLANFYTPDSRDRLADGYSQALAGVFNDQERELVTRDGRVIQTLLRAIPEPIRDGRVRGTRAMYIDITKRKRAEDALAEERALLARRVEERTADLSAANADLARAARLKDEFLASMSHELRTPLNAVLGLSEALQEQVYGLLTDQQCKALRTIEESGRHLLELINDILDLAKVGAGKLELDLDIVAIESLCQASVRLVKQDAHKKQIVVSTAIDPAVTALHTDARRLKQILVNLLSNAVKFTPDGGKVGLEVTGDAAQQAVHLTVWDTGIGIANEDLARLFQPFVQLDSRLARQYSGTGLGLALVYRMVEMHGGSVTVTSEPGAGSRFTVSLPWRSTDGVVEPDRIAPTQELTMGDRVAIHTALIVEDSPTAATQLARYLNELSITAVTHPQGEDAIERALELRPDLIVLDVLLPDTSGWSVLERLKADPRTRPIPVLIVSVVDDCAQAVTLGAADYLIKPFTREGVRLALRKLAPTGTDSAMTASRATQEQAPALANSTILLVEDNEASIATMSDYLGVKGYQVMVARNGAEAVARASELQPALILMDIQMPGMDGMEATRRIRAHGSLVRIPIIALTALVMPGDRERCLEAGADDYLSKPVSLKGLAAAIETLLRQHATEQRNPL